VRNTGSNFGKNAPSGWRKDQLVDALGTLMLVWSNETRSEEWTDEDEKQLMLLRAKKKRIRNRDRCGAMDA
jgi:hypothetical protein